MENYHSLTASHCQKDRKTKSRRFKCLQLMLSSFKKKPAPSRCPRRGLRPRPLRAPRGSRGSGSCST